MSENNPTTCPFCSMSVAQNATSCPNCGGLIPVGHADGRPSASPGGLDGPSKPIPETWKQGTNGPDPFGTGDGEQPVFASAPHLAPTPSSLGGTSNWGRNIAIIAGIAVVLLGVGTCGAMFFWVGSSSSSTSSSSPPELISLNQPVQGELTSSNNQKVYEFNLTRAGSVSISVIGDFDNYLELYLSDSESPMREDDDSGGSLNALINAPLSPGRYYALVRPYSPGTTGRYTLTVSAPSEIVGMPNPAVPQPPPLPPMGTVPGQPGGIMPPPTGGIAPPPGMTVPRYPPGAEIRNQTFVGRVTSVSGNTSIATGAQCTVFIEGHPRGRSLNCRIRVNCGSNTIYGREVASSRYGYTQCAVRDSPTGTQSIEAHDRNPSPAGGDPRMDLDTAAGQVTVSDDVAGGSWSVQINFTGGAATPSPRTST